MSEPNLKGTNVQMFYFFHVVIQVPEFFIIILYYIVGLLLDFFCHPYIEAMVAIE